MSRLAVTKRSARRFFGIVRLIFVSEQKWKAYGFLFLLVFLSVTITCIGVLRSYVDRNFMTALAAYQQAEFLKQLWLYLSLFAILTPIAVFYRVTEARFALFWREWLTRYLLELYCLPDGYKKLSKGIDNPDQRLTEDVRSFTATVLSLVLIIFNSTIAFFAFIGILWSISGVLPLVAIAYAAIGSVVIWLLGRPLVNLNFAQLKKEAELRRHLIVGEEKERVKYRLSKVISNMREIVRWNRNIGFFTDAYWNINCLLPIAIVAPLYLKHLVEFGTIIQAMGAFGNVVNSLSLVIGHFGELSSLAAVSSRLASFQDALLKKDCKQEMAVI